MGEKSFHKNWAAVNLRAPKVAKLCQCQGYKHVSLHEAMCGKTPIDVKRWLEQTLQPKKGKKGKKGSQSFPSTHPCVRHPPLNAYSGMFREHPHHIATNK